MESSKNRTGPVAIDMTRSHASADSQIRAYAWIRRDTRDNSCQEIVRSSGSSTVTQGGGERVEMAEKTPEVDT